MGIKAVYTGFWCGRPEEKRSLGRNRRRWEDISKMYLRGLIWLKMGTGGGRLRMK